MLNGSYPGGIRSWWDHAREPVIVWSPAFSHGEFSQNVIIYEAERSFDIFFNGVKS